MKIGNSRVDKKGVVPEIGIVLLAGIVVLSLSGVIYYDLSFNSSISDNSITGAFVLDKNVSGLPNQRFKITDAAISEVSGRSTSANNKLEITINSQPYVGFMNATGGNNAIDLGIRSLVFFGNNSFVNNPYNTTTDFSQQNLANISGLNLTNSTSNVSINFTEAVSLFEGADLEENVKIGTLFVGINTSALGGLNRSALITFTDFGGCTPTIFRSPTGFASRSDILNDPDVAECNAGTNPACVPISCSVSENAFILNVTSFSGYTPGNSPPDLPAIALNQTKGKFGDFINISSISAIDTNGDSYTLFCGNRSTDFLQVDPNLCTSGATESGEASCIFSSPFGDNTTHTVFCVLQDSNLANSSRASTIFTADNAPPTNIIEGGSINVDGDASDPFFDRSNNGQTLVSFTINEAESDADCLWAETDLGYSGMPSGNVCTEALILGKTKVTCDISSASVLAAQTNQTTVYFACKDRSGNEQSAADNIAVLFGFDYTQPSISTLQNLADIFVPPQNITLNVTDVPEGTVVTVQYCNITEGTEPGCSPSIPIATNGNVTFTEGMRGVHTLNITATDQAQNNLTSEFTVYINRILNFSNVSFVNTTNTHIFEAQVNLQNPESQTINCNATGTGTSFSVTKPMSLKSGTANDGTYNTTFSDADGFNATEAITVDIVCADGLENNTVSGTNAIPNAVPTAPTVDLTPNLPVTLDDLSCAVTGASTDPDGDNVDYYYEFYNNSILFNTTFTSAASVVLNNVHTMQGQVWDCKVIPTDNAQNGTSTTDTVAIQNTAPDAFSLLTPANGTNTSTAVVVFDWTDSGDDDVDEPGSQLLKYIVEVDNDFGFSSIDFEDSGIFSASPASTAAIALTDDRYSWRVQACDNSTAANNCTIATGTFNLIVDTVAPSVALNDPIDFFNTTLNDINFNWTATDSLDSLMSCSLFVDSFSLALADSINNTPTNKTLSIAEGAHLWQVNCTDDSGNNGTSVVRAFNVDQTAPSVVITSLADGDVAGFNIALAAAVNDALSGTDTVRFEVVNVTTGNVVFSADFTDDGLKSTTWATTLNNPNDGNYTFRVIANDTLGQINQTNVTFTLDNTQPGVQMINPPSPFSQRFFNRNFSLDVRYSNEHLRNVSYTINPVDDPSDVIQTNKTTFGFPGVESANFTDLVNSTIGDDEYLLTAVGVDFVNNTRTVTRTFFIDTINPSAFNVKINDSDLIVKDTASLQANATVIDESSATAKVNGLAMAQFNSTDFTITTTAAGLGCAGSGACNLTFNATDQAGNFNDTTIQQITVDGTAPNVILAEPADEFNTTSSGVTFKWSIDEDIFAAASCDLIIDSVDNVIGINTPNATNVTQAVAGILEGAHTWQVRCTDGVGNAGLSAARAFRVDNTAPVVAITAPANDQVVGHGISLIANVNDASVGTADVIFTVFNSTENVFSFNTSDDGVKSTTFTTFLGVHNDGDYTLRVEANDTVGNLADDEVNFTIDNTIPSVQIIRPSQAFVGQFNANFTLNISITNTHLINASFTIKRNLSGIVLQTNSTIFGVPVAEHSFGDLVNAGALGDDLYNISATAFDVVGNNDTESALFIIDLTAPVITAASVNDSDKIVRGTDIVKLQASAADIHLNNATVGNDTKLLMSEISAGQFELNSSADALGCGIDDGICNITFTVSDVAGNTATSIISLRIDDAEPNSTIESPADSITLGLNDIPIVVNGSADDNVEVSFVQVLVNGTNLLDTNFSNGKWNRTFTTSVGGVFNFTSIATDIAGNQEIDLESVTINVIDAVVVNSSVQNSSVENSTFANSTIINSTVSNSTVLNSMINGSNVTFTDTNNINSSNCEIAGSNLSNIDCADSNLTDVTSSSGSSGNIDPSILVSVTLGGTYNITNSNITSSTVSNIVVIKSNISSSSISNSFVNDSVLNSVTYINAVVNNTNDTGSVQLSGTLNLDPNNLFNNQYSGTITINDSTVHNGILSNVVITASFVNDSTISSSTLISSVAVGNTGTNALNSMIITNANIVNGQCNAGTIVFNGNEFNCPIAISTIVSPPSVEAAVGGGGRGGGGGGIARGACVTDWQCTEWSACQADGTQTRTCVDASNCGSLVGKPLERADCIYIAPEVPAASCTDGIRNQDETDVDCGGVCGAVCDIAENCLTDLDCASNYCRDGACEVSPIEEIPVPIVKPVPAGVRAILDYVVDYLAERIKLMAVYSAENIGDYFSRLSESSHQKNVVRKAGYEQYRLERSQLKIEIEPGRIVPMVKGASEYIGKAFEDYLAELNEASSKRELERQKAADERKAGLAEQKVGLFEKIFAKLKIPERAEERPSEAGIGFKESLTKMGSAVKGASGIILAVLLGVFAVGSVVVGYKLYSKSEMRLRRLEAKKKEHYGRSVEMLAQFIRNAALKGYGRKEIIGMLASSGWPKNVVDEAVGKFFELHGRELKEMKAKPEVGLSEKLKSVEEKLTRLR